MLKLAVIGKDVSKSLSPTLHGFILQSLGITCTYDKISISPTEFTEKVGALFDRYDAFNVTIPFKTGIIPLLKELKGDALSFGAVNTVLSKSRLGYNTDGYGFRLMLENEGITLYGKKVLVLGAGGAGRSCIKQLTGAGADVFVYERDVERLQEVYAEFGGFTPLREMPLKFFDIIVNCTGVGMHDTVGQIPTLIYANGVSESKGFESLIVRSEIAVDLIYEPKQSEFLRAASIMGKRTINGEAMLFYQAYLADCIILERAPSAEEAKRLFEKYGERQ